MKAESFAFGKNACFKLYMFLLELTKAKLNDSRGKTFVNNVIVINV